MQAISNPLCGEFVTSSEAETEALGSQFGQALAQAAAPCALVLEGALGAGKTRFVRGLVAGMGGDPLLVASPTFALVHEYPTGKWPVAHMDFYRLRSADEIFSLGWDDSLLEAVVAVEWGNRFPEVFPPGSWHLHFRETAPMVREIMIQPLENVTGEKKLKE